MTIRPLLLALALSLTAAPVLAGETQPSCMGTDLVAKAKAEQPEKYAVFEREATAIPNAEGLLWKIEAKGVAPSYLFGTMHTTEADLTALSAPLRDAIARSETVAVELANADGAVAKAKMLSYVTSNGIDFSGGGLTWLTAEQADTVKRRIVEAGLPEQAATMLKPWFLAITLQVSSCELQKMGAGLPTIDAAIEKAGRDKGADIVGLESITEQLDAVSKVSDETARRMIRDVVAKPQAGDDLQATTLALYRARKVGWYFAMKGDLFGAAIDVSANADFLSDIVDRRNRLMAERSKPLIDKGAALIAVGALHLSGQNGLIELFRKQGYTVTKIW